MVCHCREGALTGKHAHRSLRRSSLHLHRAVHVTAIVPVTTVLRHLHRIADAHRWTRETHWQCLDRRLADELDWTDNDEVV
jgi:hypothetical protein